MSQAAYYETPEQAHDALSEALTAKPYAALILLRPDTADLLRMTRPEGMARAATYRGLPCRIGGVGAPFTILDMTSAQIKAPPP